MMNFSAPKRPVISRDRLLSLPTISLKNCGPKYASAVMPVHCWPQKMKKARPSR